MSNLFKILIILLFRYTLLSIFIYDSQVPILLLDWLEVPVSVIPTIY